MDRQFIKKKIELLEKSLKTQEESADTVEANILELETLIEFWKNQKV